MRVTAIMTLIVVLTGLSDRPVTGQPHAQTSAVDSAADRTTPRVIHAARIGDGAEAPVIDGRLTEGDWAGSDRTHFIQHQPAAGEASTQATRVAITYDAHAIYIAMRLYDSAPDSIAGQLSRRDVRGDHSDWAHVYLDSYYDQRTAFRFSVNPRGVQLDALHFGDSRQDDGWNAVWTAKTTVDSVGWSAEFRIPFSQLRYATDDSETARVWGVNFGREIARYGEVAYWSPIPADAAGFVSQFGRLQGLRALPTPRRLELQPYTLTRVTQSPPQLDNPLHASRQLSTTAGVDIRYGLTSDFTLNVAINPDFGQVEADPSVVNLSAFETFFPEKRAFFVEGTDLFGLTFPQWPPLFYSRRVGRAPQGSVPGDAVYADIPEASTIVAAAKLTGKTSRGLSIGALGAVTGAESARVTDDTGAIGRVPVEPTTSYAATRIIQDFRDGQSAVGAIVTATRRNLVDRLRFLHHGAYVGGIDGRHRFGNGNFEITGSAVASYVHGSAEALTRTQGRSGRYYQRPDADHLAFDSTRTSLTGAQAGLRLAKVGGGHWRWEMNGTYVSPGFEVNDLGFGNGGDRASVFTRVGYVQYQPSGPFRRWDLSVVHASGWTTAGEHRYGWVQLFGSGQFRNQWSVNVGVDRTFSSLSTETLRGGPAFRTSGYVSGWLGFDSDPRPAVRIGGWGFWMVRDQHRGHQLDVNPKISYRPSTRMDLTLQPGVTWNVNTAQYVTTQTTDAGPRYVFGELRQLTTSLTTRFNYTFSPTLSLQAYAQPFISSGRYDAFRRVVDAGARRTEDQLTPLDGASSDVPTPDFNFKQFRSNVVLRWEYRPGSTLFLVWSQDRTAFDPDGSYDLRRDLDRLFTADGRNVFLVKLNFWMGR